MFLLSFGHFLFTPTGLLFLWRILGFAQSTCPPPLAPGSLFFHCLCFGSLWGLGLLPFYQLETWWGAETSLLRVSPPLALPRRADRSPRATQAWPPWGQLCS